MAPSAEKKGRKEGRKERNLFAPFMSKEHLDCEFCELSLKYANLITLITTSSCKEGSTLNVLETVRRLHRPLYINK